VIVLREAHARVPPLTLAPLTATLDAGTHALLGGRLDGPWLVLAILAGRCKLRGGSVRMSGGSPTDRHASRALAYVPLDVALPEPFRVDEVLRMASEVRGEAAKDASSRLAVLGSAALATREVRSLTREERRAVALAEAVTCEAPVILVDEPLMGMDTRAAAAAGEALRARAAEGACVVVATASMRDARSLADDVLTFDRGVLARRAPASDPLVLAGPRGATVRVVSSDATRLAAALGEESGVRGVSVAADVVVARGADALAIAGAVARAASRADVTVESLVPDLLHDDELRAALSVRAPSSPLAAAAAPEGSAA
jgi:ABC-type multidrug transport system ATPase subunit